MTWDSTSWATVLLVFALLYFILTNLSVYSIRRRERLLQHRDQALLFQLISHEVRTPMTALKLNLDGLRNQFDALDENGQKNLMHSFENFHSLERIIQTTLKELKGENNVSRFDAVEMAEWLVHNDFTDLVEFHPEVDRLNVQLSPFWYEIFLSNLIRNALNHGKAPITVHIRQQDDQALIEVRDAGDTSLENLRRSLKPFQKGEKSKGLGLGLSIVSRKVREFDGELIVKDNPTRFILRFPIKINEEKENETSAFS